MRRNLTESIFSLEYNDSMNKPEWDTYGGANHHNVNVDKYAEPEEMLEHTMCDK